MDKDIYSRIDDELEKRKMSRRQLAAAAGIPESTISMAFKRRSAAFSASNIVKIANALNMTWQELVVGTDIETRTSVAIDNRHEVAVVAGRTFLNGVDVTDRDKPHDDRIDLIERSFTRMRESKDDDGILTATKTIGLIENWTPEERFTAWKILTAFDEHIKREKRK